MGVEWIGLFLVQILSSKSAFPCHRAELGSRKGLTPTGSPELDNSQLKHQNVVRHFVMEMKIMGGLKLPKKIQRPPENV